MLGMAMGKLIICMGKHAKARVRQQAGSFLVNGKGLTGSASLHKNIPQSNADLLMGELRPNQPAAATFARPSRAAASASSMVARKCASGACTPCACSILRTAGRAPLI